MEMAKELSPAHEKWNSQVEEKVNLVRENDDKGTRQVDTWLERIENDKKNYAWNDQVSAGRARHYLALAKHFPDLSKHYQELAILEIYSLQYATPEEKRLWRESMDIVE
jgi:predicted nuclease with TOPRIM domain